MRTIETLQEEMVESPRYIPAPQPVRMDSRGVVQNHRGNGECSTPASGERSVKLPAHAVAQAMATPVLRGLLPLAAGFARNSHGQSRQPVLPAGEALLLYCTKGEGWCEIGGRRHRIPTDTLLVLSGETARVYGADSRPGWSFCWVHATGANLDYFINQLGASTERPVLEVGEDARLVGWFLELLETLGSDCPPARLLYASQTLAHLLSALICCQRAGETETVDKIQRSIAYMKQHLSEPLRAATLASVAHMSLPHYFALFKQRVGRTPIDYFIKLRIEQARHLLAETSWSIKEVAAALGYEDPLYFSRVFKSVTRATPSEYRHKRKNGAVYRTGGRMP